MVSRRLFALAPVLLTVALAQHVSAQATKPFPNVTEAIGLKGLGGGMATWIDFDDDGWVDLFDGGSLWRNQGGKSFEKIAAPGISGGGTWGDFDADGKVDFYSPGGTGRLYRGLGGGKFAVVEKAVPPLPMKAPMCAVCGDFNGDGLLDLYL